MVKHQVPDSFLVHSEDLVSLNLYLDPLPPGRGEGAFQFHWNHLVYDLFVGSIIYSSVCMCVCMYVCMYVSMYVSMFVCIYV